MYVAVTPLGSAPPAAGVALALDALDPCDALDVDDAAPDRLGAADFDFDALADDEPPLVLLAELEHATKQSPSIGP